MKARLYLEQDGKSAYTLEPLSLGEVITNPRYTEIDHIIPISISLDDLITTKFLRLPMKIKQRVIEHQLMLIISIYLIIQH